MSNGTVKLSDHVFSTLAERGVRHVFMLAGGGAMHLNESLGDTPGIDFVAMLHEQGAAIAAEAYAQYTNELGVALVTTGPGGTNALTGVAGAWLESTPLLVLSGQVKRADLIGDRGVRQMGFQELPITEVAAPITKYAVTVMEAETIRFHLEKALYLARAGRPGPVWVDIPLDVQSARIRPNELDGFVPPAPERDPDLDALAEGTLSSLAAAERPVALVGNGVRLARAERDCLRLLERLNVPILTTWKMADLLPEDHPLFAGRPGAIGQRAANFALQNADWLLAIGARLDLGQTGYMHRLLARAATKIVVDIDAAEIGKLDMDIAIRVPADAGEFVRALDRASQGVSAPPRSEWLTRIRDWRARYPVVQPSYREQTGFVNTYVLLDVLSDALGGDDLVVHGSSGSCSEMTCQTLRVRQGMRVIGTHGLGSMGFGVPAALGGCLASGRRTVCLDGDGSFAMNAQELEVVRRLDLPVKYFILNNDGYASIRTSQRTHFAGRLVGADPTSGLTLPDTLAVAGAYGIPTSRLTDHTGIEERVAEVLASPGPHVCEVMVSPDLLTEPRLSSYVRPDGTVTSRPLEDLAPFLARDEFAAQMTVPPVEED